MIFIEGKGVCEGFCDVLKIGFGVSPFSNHGVWMNVFGDGVLLE
jgi:hypothetical protein